MKIEEGYMPYLGHQTYYRVVGEQSGNKKPLIVMHGGPGSTHNYFEVLDEMAVDGRQIIMYDQLGCGKSAVPSQPELWTAETWVNELIALREHLGLDEVHLLGQSWGGMLEIIYVCDYAPKGIKSMVLSSTLPSAKLWAQEQHRMIKFMSEEDQAAIAKAEETGVYDDPAYLAANDRFMVRHAAPVFTKDDPEPLWREKVAGTESYVTAWGPNEYSPEGTLQGYDYTEKLRDVTIPTLVTSGTNDLCTPLVAKTMYDAIPGAKWELFANSRHMPFVEEREKYMKLLEEWLMRTINFLKREGMIVETTPVKTKKPFGFYVCALGFSFERCAFYTVKYMLAIWIAVNVGSGGLGLSTAKAASVSAAFVAMTYITPIFGGWLADYWLSPRLCVAAGMILMGVGYLFTWQADSLTMVWIMIILVSIGTGLFKGNLSGVNGLLFDDEKH